MQVWLRPWIIFRDEQVAQIRSLPQDNSLEDPLDPIESPRETQRPPFRHKTNTVVNPLLLDANLPRLSSDWDRLNYSQSSWCLYLTFSSLDHDQNAESKYAASGILSQKKSWRGTGTQIVPTVASSKTACARLCDYAHRGQHRTLWSIVPSNVGWLHSSYQLGFL